MDDGDASRRSVVLIAPTWPPMACGIASYARELAAGLADQGREIVVITDEKAGPVRHRDVRLRHWSLTEWPKILGAIRRTRPEIIHLQHPTRATRARPLVYALPALCRLFSRESRVVTTFHYIRPVSARTAFLRVLFLIPAACCHAVVVTTEWEAAYVRRLLPGKRVMVASAGPAFAMTPPSPSARALARRHLGLDGEEFVIGYFGYLLPNKGLEVLLEAVKRLSQARLLVAGDGYDLAGGYPRQLRARARVLGIEGRVRWLGRVDEADAARHLGAADCLALPFDEGASLKRSTLIAAWQLARPVVTTRGPELDPQMRDGDNILLVPPRDAGALAAALDRLRRDGRLRSRVASGSLDLLGLVSWKSINDRHGELYDSLRLRTPRVSTTDSQWRPHAPTTHLDSKPGRWRS